VPRERRGCTANKQDVRGLFHHEPRCADGMPYPFNRSHRSGPQSGTLHDRCIHPSYPIQLKSRADARIEESRCFEELDGRFDRMQ
jgi:hypothetical protein